jgi:regulator of protease activity HflC (stomatin/prohibitin superfamily)
MEVNIEGVIFIFGGFIVLLFFFLRIVREYERAVIFRLGRLAGTRGPGLFILIPLIEKMEKIDLRTVTLDVPAQDVISKDNVPVNVDAVLYFRVVEPIKAVVEVENFMVATSQISQTTLRSVTGKATFDELLAEREKLNEELHHVIDDATDAWGIKVMGVEIKHVETPEEMQRAIAKQAEAERIRRAKIILAEGEFQAAAKLREAADILKADPIKLRYLETLAEAAREKSVTILFPAELTDIVRNVGSKPQ